MWLFSTIGFFSVVACDEHPDAVVVRARARADLEALRDRVLPDMEIAATPQRDYAYCAVVRRDEWAHAAYRLAEAIDYPTFWMDQRADRQNPGAEPD